ncbi:Rab-3A-interacting protein-like protein, partial [Leptotrombidium deliense]
CRSLLSDETSQTQSGMATETEVVSSPETESASSLDEISLSSAPSEERKKSCSSVAEVKEMAALRLEKELSKAQRELQLRDEEIAKLSRIRTEIESELEDLTASLFEEANNMVQKAHMQRAKAEKAVKEGNMKIEVLEGEVKALKAMVLSSTTQTMPHTPEKKNGLRKSSLLPSLGSPRRSPSNYELGGAPALPAHENHFEVEADMFSSPAIGEVDPAYHEEFTEWKKNPVMKKESSAFLKRIYNEEIYPVFNFKNTSLTNETLASIEDNSIIVESVSEKSSFPKKCALLDIPRVCKYRMKLKDTWYNISELCRNRIIAVCDLFSYLRYIQEGLVKSGFHEIYWEVMRRRRNIALSRLGFPIS